MTKNGCARYYQLGVISCLVIVGAISTSGERVIAQIRADNSLGAESSRRERNKLGCFVVHTWRSENY